MRSLFRRRPPRPTWDPTTPIIRLSAGDTITLGDLYSGVQVWGSTGSGKTSGSMRALCRGLFKAGAGALCLCAKRDDRALYERYARECGRGQDVLIFGPDDSMLRYNFIEAELARDGKSGSESRGPGLVTNLTALLMTLSEISSRGGCSGGTSREDEGYFRRAAQQLSTNALHALVVASRVGGAVGSRGGVSIPDLQRYVTSMPQSMEEVASPSWREQSFCFRTLQAAERAPMTESERLDLDLSISYALGEWATLADRTKSSVLSTLTSTLDLLSRGTCRDLLSSPTTNVSPEQCWGGAIVIVDLPVLVYHDIARLIAVILKFCWQRASMRRDLSRGDRPMAIIADESHLFAASPDWEFQAVARGSNTATIYATQSLSNYLEVFGEHSESRVHALLGNLQTQFFHQLTDVRTIRYAQDLIGTRRTLLFSGNTSCASSDLGAILGMGDPGTSAGFSEQELPELRASHLNSLRKGGPANRFVVDALLYQGGKVFKATRRTWRPVSFVQS
ncbi:MAG: type IV secretory system conjugative DNA transfer family protein [Phycisphaerales bacterium]